MLQNENEIIVYYDIFFIINRTSYRGQNDHTNMLIVVHLATLVPCYLVSQVSCNLSIIPRVSCSWSLFVLFMTLCELGPVSLSFAFLVFCYFFVCVCCLLHLDPAFRVHERYRELRDGLYVCDGADREHMEPRDSLCGQNRADREHRQFTKGLGRRDQTGRSGITGCDRASSLHSEIRDGTQCHIDSSAFFFFFHVHMTTKTTIFYMPG